jgi:hypothetical protein
MSAAAAAVAERNLRDVTLVRQRYENDCVVACMAMILGEPYEQVRAWWPPKHDFDLRLTNISWGEALLANRGYATLWRSSHIFGKKQAPWPPAPFADVHYCIVRTTPDKQYSRLRHLVVMRYDGQVLDPSPHMPELWHSVADYYKVLEVVGVYKV